MKTRLSSVDAWICLLTIMTSINTKHNYDDDDDDDDGNKTIIASCFQFRLYLRKLPCLTCLLLLILHTNTHTLSALFSLVGPADLSRNVFFGPTRCGVGERFVLYSFIDNAQPGARSNEISNNYSPLLDCKVHKTSFVKTDDVEGG